MSNPPKSDHIYFIVNKKLHLAWDLSHQHKNAVVATKLAKEKSQKV